LRESVGRAPIFLCLIRVSPFTGSKTAQWSSVSREGKPDVPHDPEIKFDFKFALRGHTAMQVIVSLLSLLTALTWAAVQLLR
jgi:hypothetical protein